MFHTLFNYTDQFTEPHFIFTVPHIHTSEQCKSIFCCHSAALWETSCAEGELHLIYTMRLVYLVREVVAIHLVAVGLTSWTLNFNAMALQDGCFFKNTNPIIAYRPQTATRSDASRQWRKVRLKELRSCTLISNLKATLLNNLTRLRCFGLHLHSAVAE